MLMTMMMMVMRDISLSIGAVDRNGGVPFRRCFFKTTCVTLSVVTFYWSRAELPFVVVESPLVSAISILKSNAFCTGTVMHKDYIMQMKDKEERERGNVLSVLMYRKIRCKGKDWIKNLTRRPSTSLE